MRGSRLEILDLVKPSSVADCYADFVTGLEKENQYAEADEAGGSSELCCESVSILFCPLTCEYGQKDDIGGMGRRVRSKTTDKNEIAGHFPVGVP